MRHYADMMARQPCHIRMRCKRAKPTLTGLDGDGVTKVGAVQLPGDAQLPLRRDKVMLLARFALGHHQLLAIQAHCASMALSEQLPQPYTLALSVRQKRTCLSAGEINDAGCGQALTYAPQTGGVISYTKVCRKVTGACVD